MANRAYLYSATSDFGKMRDLSESRHPIPLVYQVLLSSETAICDSRIWKYEHPIAIKADFAQGLQRLLDLYEFLKTQPGFDSAKLEGYIRDTKDYFEKNADRKLDIFFLEAGEVFDLIGDMEPIEEQNEDLAREIGWLSKDLDTIFRERPADVFSRINLGWLTELKANPDLLEPYWTTVTYFSFNKSGQEG